MVVPESISGVVVSDVVVSGVVIPESISDVVVSDVVVPDVDVVPGCFSVLGWASGPNSGVHPIVAMGGDDPLFTLC